MTDKAAHIGRIIVSLPKSRPIQQLFPMPPSSCEGARRDKSGTPGAVTVCSAHPVRLISRGGKALLEKEPSVDLLLVDVFLDRASRDQSAMRIQLGAVRAFEHTGSDTILSKACTFASATVRSCREFAAYLCRTRVFLGFQRCAVSLSER
jgi:hypothetical protein